MTNTFIKDFISVTKELTSKLWNEYRQLPLSPESNNLISKLERDNNASSDPQEKMDLNNQIAYIHDTGSRILQQEIGTDVLSYVITFEIYFSVNFPKHFSAHESKFNQSIKHFIDDIKLTNYSKTERIEKLRDLLYSLDSATFRTLDFPGDLESGIGLRVLESLEKQTRNVIAELATLRAESLPRYDFDKIRSFLKDPYEIDPKPKKFTGVKSKRKEETYYLTGQLADLQDAGFLEFKEDHESFCSFTVKAKKIFTEEMLYQVYKNILAFSDNRHDEIVPLNIKKFTITYLGAAVYELFYGKFFKSDRKKLEDFYVKSFKIKGEDITSISSLRRKAD